MWFMRSWCVLTGGQITTSADAAVAVVRAVSTSTHSVRPAVYLMPLVIITALVLLLLLSVFV